MKRSSAISLWRRRQRGQSTVEFMLMVPVLLSIFFFVIEMSLYFTTVHYGTYAAFATARSQQVGFSSDGSRNSADEVGAMILNGAIWLDTKATPVNNASGISIQVANFEEKVPFPFLKPLMPNLNLDTRVHLGSDERCYEGVEGRASDRYDNNSGYTCG